MTGTLLFTAAAAFASVVLVTPLAGVIAARAGLVDQPNHHRAHSHPTPYLGGVAIAAGIVGSALFARAALPHRYERQLLVILACAAGMALMGFLDDWRPSHPRWRILSQFAASAAVVAVGVELRVTPWRGVNIALTVAWIVGITNAVNLLDNMDGLASGAVAIAAAGCAFLAVEEGQRLVSVMAVAVSSAALGFLVHNRPPARIFMGDAGSLSLGFLLATTVAKLNLVEAPGPRRLIIVALLCGLGILDTALVVVSRLSRHLSPFTGGTDHSSHRLVRSGLTPGRAVLVLHAIAGWFVASAILVRHSGSVVSVVGITLAALVVAGTLGAFLRMPAEGPLSRASALADE